jgi:plasmid stabilization system protein ParE
MRTSILTRFGNTSLRITSKPADRWIGKLFDAFEALGLTPGMGHKREDLTPYAVLFWPVGAYLIIYRADCWPIEIVAVT